MARDIPFAKLGISTRLEPQLGAGAPSKVKLAIARGLLPLPPAEHIGALYVLYGDEDPEVREAALQSICDLPTKQILPVISAKTHPKILEFLTEFRPPDPELDERIGMLRTANDRTVVKIAERAGKDVCELLARNHERLLMTPGVFVALHANPACADATLQSAESFLRMQRALPEIPAVRPFLAGGDDIQPGQPAPAAPQAPRALEMDLMAEVEAALRGEQSPAFVQAQSSDLDMFDLDALDEGPATQAAPLSTVGEFSFDFADESDDFSWNLTGEIESESYDERKEVASSIERQIADMSVGHRIKLAYRGNKMTRSILIRDSNKVVASAVVRSGRLTDQEVANYAGNKNLDGDVLREIASNREYTRKYPVKVALVNNPKTPVSMAVSLVSAMQKKDLLALTRNRNVPSVITEAAIRLYRQKHQKD